MSKKNRKNGVVDQVKYKKRVSKIKWTDREYHFQDNSGVSYKEVKMYCNINQLPALPFCGPHPKHHGARGFSKQYNFRFDPKLGHGICAIIRIPYSCFGYTSMIDTPRISVIPSKKKSRYKHVTNYTY